MLFKSLSTLINVESNNSNIIINKQSNQTFSTSLNNVAGTNKYSGAMFTRPMYM